MASVTAGGRVEKPSFAKIAAVGIHPSSSQQTSTPTEKTPQNAIASTPRIGAPLLSSCTTTSASALPTKQDTNSSKSPLASHEAGSMTTSGSHIQVQVVAPAEVHSAAGAPIPIPADEASTQISSSSDSVKPPSLDGKSVASGTTFALDEKESLRPDDSASVKATEDEDLFSAPSAGLPESRGGSDDGARAFREQLKEISGIDLSRHPVPPQNFAQPALVPPGVLYVPPQGPGLGTVPGAARPPPVNGDSVGVPPDPKLLEALDSPKDRIMVLKLEQDIVDFVNQPKESSLKLPQTNAFYRMLAHRLADYYMLGHVVDESTQAVRIYKTPNCRLPQPLTDVATPSTAASTPPPLGMQMKILRRGDLLARSAADGPHLTSKTTSENGESGNEDDKKSRAPVSREEREARYEAARKRIMGYAKPSDSPDDSAQKEISRPSSTSGRKATKKKPRADSDDDFEARSAYSAYYATAYGPNSPATHGIPSYGTSNNQQPTPLPFGGSDVSPSKYQPIMAPNQGSWAQPSYQAAPMQPNWPANVPHGYDMPNEFQRTMNLQSAMVSQPPAAQSMYQAGFNAPNYGQQQVWPPQTYNMPNPPGATNYGYVPTFPGRPSSSSSQPQENQQYAFGQLPSQTFPGRTSNKVEHPLPGSYKSKHFNPQSQSFIPNQSGGMISGRMAGQGPPLNNPGLSSGFGPVSAPQQQYTTNPHQGPTYGSPLPAQASPANARVSSQLMTHPLPQPVFPRQPSPHVPLPPRPDASLQAPTEIKYPPVVNQPIATPPVVQSQSSIAKWGTPASLPPKPPPSAEPFDAARYTQIGRQPPPHGSAHGSAPALRGINGYPIFGTMAGPMAGGLGIAQQSSPAPRRS